MSDPIVILFALMSGVFIFSLGVELGKKIKEYPSEDEMIRRIVEKRIHARVQKDVESALADELNRRSAA